MFCSLLFLQIVDGLRKENFELKLRIFYLESRLDALVPGEHKKIYQEVSYISPHLF